MINFINYLIESGLHLHFKHNSNNIKGALVKRSSIKIGHRITVLNIAVMVQLQRCRN